MQQTQLKPLWAQIKYEVHFIGVIHDTRNSHTHTHKAQSTVKA